MSASRDVDPVEISARARELFAALTSNPRGGGGDEVRELCRAHPELRAELETLAAAEERSLLDSGERSRLAKLSAQTNADVRYEVRAEIGRGGMGRVLEVWDTDLRRSLAMKVLTRPIGGGDPARMELATARFLEEAQVTGQLDHPGVVPVHELGVDGEGVAYFTMRRVRGRDLREVVELVQEEREGWNLTRVLNVVLRICEAMAFAHEHGVVHRDLKPANVMIGRFGEVYVMDWGLACVHGRESAARDIRPRREASVSLSEVATDRREAVEEDVDSPLLTMDGAVIGTPAYMSPEQARGQIEDVGPRSDVYSVGALLYHVLTGRMPYVDPGARVSRHTVLAMVLQGPPRPIHEIARDVPAEVIAIAEKAMAREAADRYADMEAMAGDLRAYLEHRVVHAYETGAWAEARKWVRRNRGMAAASAAALLVGLVAIAGILKTQAAGRREEFLTADTFRLPYYLTEAERLWPAHPDRVPDFESWLVHAEELSERLPIHEERLKEARARAATGGDAQREELEAQAALVTGLRALEDEDPAISMTAAVRERLEFARTVEERTISGATARRLWSQAQAAIADPAVCPAYGGLHIEPQLGLVPLGIDPRSGLFEFAHLETGTLPQRDARNELILGPDMAIVLVLLPGGRFTMGAEPPTADRPLGSPNIDPHANSSEHPVHEVELAPFFISKYELTQGQWRRATHTNPSSYTADYHLVEALRGDLHPVEKVSWQVSRRVLEEHRLALPTEAQWEYAARAGTSTIWSSGDAKETLEGRVNIADAAALREGAKWEELQDWPELDDGFPIHAPVGSFEPNPFGLHDMHGNVYEWCADWNSSSYSLPTRPGDGLRQAPENARYRIYRGGSFREKADKARSAYRHHESDAVQENDVGVRAVRPIDELTPEGRGG